MAFDLLELNGRKLWDRRYRERRSLLASLGLDGQSWQAPDHHVGDGAAFLDASREMSLEGIVAKRLDGVYHPGLRARRDWGQGQENWRLGEFVVGGWLPADGRHRIGGLPVGALIEPIAGWSHPFATWAEPVTEVQVRYLERTPTGFLRHACFAGLKGSVCWMS